MAFISALSPWLHRAKESPLLVGAAVLVVVGGVMLKRFLTYKRVEAEDVPVKGNPAGKIWCDRATQRGQTAVHSNVHSIIP